MAQQDQGHVADGGGREKEVVVTHGFATDTDYEEERHVAARHRHDRYRDAQGGGNRGLLGALAGLAVAAAAGAAFAAYRRQSGGHPDAYGNLEIDENDRLISSSKVENTAVYNLSGERLGEVKNFMVDKFSGQVRYAVLSFGGLMGLGERHYPLPWDVLTYDEDMGGYVVDLDKEMLEGAPSYEAGEEPAFDTVYRRQILLFYR
jgi:sporulation protein YlmC with PRC-barrel domain